VKRRIESPLAVWSMMIGLGAFLSLGIRGDRVVPGYVKVIENPSTKLFVSPPCFRNGNITGEFSAESKDFAELVGEETLYSTHQTAVRSGKRPDPACANADGFVEKNSLVFTLLGIPPLLRGSRWNDDGTWNY
jgi:hypothetical protein